MTKCNCPLPRARPSCVCICPFSRDPRDTRHAQCLLELECLVVGVVVPRDSELPGASRNSQLATPRNGQMVFQLPGVLPTSVWPGDVSCNRGGFGGAGNLRPDDETPRGCAAKGGADPLLTKIGSNASNTIQSLSVEATEDDALAEKGSRGGDNEV